MDEASRSSFYEDDLHLNHPTTEVTSYLKSEGGAFTVNSICQPLDDGKPNLRTKTYSNDGCDFTVPVCNEQTCQLAEFGSRKDMDNTTSMSTFLPQESRTALSTRLVGKKALMTSNLEDLGDSSPEFSTDIAVVLSSLCKRQRLHENGYEANEDDTGKSGERDSRERQLYLDWNANSEFESELVNKVPAGWPAIGVKSITAENKIVSPNSTLSFFTLMERAHLLSEEQLDEIKKLEQIEHPDQSHRSALKRSSPSHETCVSRAEKFAKIGLDTVEENSIDDHELYLQEETGNDCSDGNRRNADQEVPIQQADSNSNGQAEAKDATILNAQWYGNSDKVTCNVSYSETPASNAKTNTLSWQDSTEEGKSFHEGSSNGRSPCDKSFCLKFATESNSALGAENTKQAFGISCLTDDQVTISSDPSQKQQTVSVPNEHVVPFVACKIPLIPPKTTNERELCSSLRTIDERDLIDDVQQCLDDADCDSLHSRNQLVTREVSSLYEPEEVQDLVDYDAFTNDLKRLQGLECLTSSGESPNKPVLRIECFDKVKVKEWPEIEPEDFSLEEQHLVHNAASSINKDCVALENAEENSPFSVAAESIHGQLQDAQNHYDKTPPDNMQNKRPTSQEKRKKISDVSGVVSNSKITVALLKKSEVLNMATTVSISGNDDDKENKLEFSAEYGQQGNQNVVDESSGSKDEKKTNDGHHDKSDHFRAQIESGMRDLDGPELLQFAMKFVQSALKKSQTVAGCSDPLQYHEEKTEKSRAAPVFSWKSKLTYHSQHAPSVPTNDEKSSHVPGSSFHVQENRENGEADNVEGPHLVRPLSSISCNRPLRLGLSRKHSSKPLHPHFK